MGEINITDYVNQYKCRKYFTIINSTLTNLEKNDGIKYVDNCYFVFPKDFKNCIDNLNKNLYTVEYCKNKNKYFVGLYK
jgi:hypothetical protein